MKRIEEFTAEEVWEAIDKDAGVTDDTIQVALDYIKANLDTGKREPMSVEQIQNFLIALEDESSDNTKRDKNTNQCFTNFVWLAEKLQPLTVQQGFVPDWSKAPVWAVEWCGCWLGERNAGTGEKRLKLEWEVVRRPVPKMRQKTREEKVFEVVAKIGDNGMLWEYSDEVVDYICRAAGIPLETKE